jgi:hypothetical protein
MIRTLGTWVLGFLGALVQDAPLPVPSESAQREAEKTIREVFQADYAQKTPAALQKLGKLLLDQARQTRDDPPTRYVLFREAADVGVRGGDPRTAMGALEGMAKAFQVDELALKEAALAKLDGSVVRPEDARALSEAYLKAAQTATAAGRWEAAVKSVQGAATAAKKSKDVTLLLRADARSKEVSEAKAASDRAAKAEEGLKARPDDPQLNRDLGEYLCLVKGDWEQGLRHLAQGTDPALRALALRDLAAPTDLARKVEVADGWWELADREKVPERRAQLQKRAVTWYQAGQAEATGLLKAKLEKRIFQILPPPKPESQAVAPPAEGLVVSWRFDEGTGDTVENAAGPANRGSLQSGPQWVDGRVGKALSFNGAGSYVTCAAAGLPAAEAPKSFSWWARYSAVPANVQSMISLSDDPPSVTVQAGFREGRFLIWKFGGTPLVAIPPPVPEVWHHFAYVFDGSRHTLYVDGKPEQTSVGGQSTGALTKLEVGRWGGGPGAAGVPGEYYNGLLDELRIYSRALSEGEVAAQASSGK